MNKLSAALAYIPHVLAAYPALSAALLNVAVIVAAHFGLAITGADLVYIMGIITVLFGAIVHSNVVPLAKLAAKPAVVLAVAEIPPAAIAAEEKVA